jgi:predicted transcriptional regulator
VQVRDFCSRDVITVEPLASLRAASLLMRNRHVGTLVVVEDARPVGIVTDRDIVVAVIAVPGARPEGIRVCDVMQTDLALAAEDDGVFEVVEKMRARGLRRLVVVAADGSLAGVVTADDVLRVMAAELGRLATALDRGGERESAERRPLDVA